MSGPREGLFLDGVMLLPRRSEVLPSEAFIETRLSPSPSAIAIMTASSDETALCRGSIDGTVTPQRSFTTCTYRAVLSMMPCRSAPLSRMKTM